MEVCRNLGHTAASWWRRLLQSQLRKFDCANRTRGGPGFEVNAGSLRRRAYIIDDDRAQGEIASVIPELVGIQSHRRETAAYVQAFDAAVVIPADAVVGNSNEQAILRRGKTRIEGLSKRYWCACGRAG